MKPRYINLIIDMRVAIIAIAILLVGATFAFTGDKEASIVNIHAVRITATNGTVSYPPSTADTWLLMDQSSLVAALTVPFPSNPSEGQVFGISVRSTITTLTLTSVSSIINQVSTLLAGSRIAWTYSSAADRWFAY